MLNTLCDGRVDSLDRSTTFHSGHVVASIGIVNHFHNLSEIIPLLRDRFQLEGQVVAILPQLVVVVPQVVVVLPEVVVVLPQVVVVLPEVVVVLPQVVVVLPQVVVVLPQLLVSIDLERISGDVFNFSSQVVENSIEEDDLLLDQLCFF